MLRLVKKGLTLAIADDILILIFIMGVVTPVDKRHYSHYEINNITD